MPKKLAMKFPKRFLWGVATAAHQVEGNQHNQWTVWELENAKTRAAQAEYHLGDLEAWSRIATAAKQPSTYVSGKGIDHASQYETDFDLLQKMNLNAYRFSVEWSRIEPKEGAWDVEAIEYYKQYIRSLKRRNIEPMMTLFHFSLPIWFSDKGGFEKRGNTKYFLRFVEKAMSELGADIKYVITINEPEVYALQSYYEGNWPPAAHSKWKTYRVLKNLIHAHNKAAKLIHGLNRRYKVSIAKNSAYIYPGDDAWLTRFSANVLQYFQDDYVLRRVRKSCDFLGINYYFSNRVYGYRVHNPDDRLSDLGWDMQPENLEFVLERLYQKYKLPIIVTENGLADATDKDRTWWLGKTLLALAGAMSEGVDVRGYFHWSLIDNFEWANGTWPRFGLVEVDYKTSDRNLRPSAVWWAKMIKKLRQTES